MSLLEKELKENLDPIFKKIYGSTAEIKELVCKEANVEGFGYQVEVKYQTRGLKVIANHYVSSLMGSGGVPFSIDGHFTKYGKNVCNNLEELGKIMGAAFNPNKS